ncbi:LPXTG cell wall anchor domain-containing protein [Glycomyces luteolus]|uniref:LPXTG cell wall anchor domain-containing protein n=1 Tax=Glycomyces luteolus TaxID=2670330 RepID=A0A9X3STH7_9ACTN|nr:LPXTG cell wall anchor domain-containing protein [Glycomyces luteolus]MDA1362234.1 LPXTG cell wall anchor domain-containing protein [Glycomyces luteolus]
MSTLNKTGLRVAAAGAAAALTLAVGAPAFAQTEAPEDATTPATDASPSPETETESTPATDTETTETETEEEEAPVVTEPPVDEELPEASEEGYEYEFAFLNHILTGANPGETLTAFPHMRVNGESGLGDERGATVLWFEDSSDVDAWFNDGELVFTDAVDVIADYDNCDRFEETVYCVLTDFDPQVGTTYTPSEDTPVLYEVLNAVTEADGAAYGAYDITKDELAIEIEAGLDPESDNNLTLVETEWDIEDEYFSDFFGWVFFEGDDRGWGQVPGGENPELPSTGNSSIILISSAAAALLAGAVVFFMLRRRKAATTWE